MTNFFWKRSPPSLFYLYRHRPARRVACPPSHVRRSVYADGSRKSRLCSDRAQALRPPFLPQYAYTLSVAALPYLSLNPCFLVGLLYIFLAVFLCVCAFLRARHSRHDFADHHSDGNDTAPLLVIPTVGQEHAQSVGRPFVTAGRIVAFVACVVTATELALLALVLRL